MSPADIRKLADEQHINSIAVGMETERVLRALADVVEAAPRFLECQTFHHTKKDIHEAAAPCPPLNRYNEALARVEALQP